MAFNRNFFMEVEQSLEEMSDERPLLPSGEYVATIGTFEHDKWLKSFAGKEREDGTVGSDSHRVNIPCVISITDEDVLEIVGMPRFTVFYNLSLDVNDGQIDTRKGKNWRLGALRKITQTNYSGFWFSHLEGKVIKVTVGTNTNPNNGEVNNVVTKVAALDD